MTDITPNEIDRLSAESVRLEIKGDYIDDSRV